jgi:CheY-like chemotaxis protein
MYKEVVMPSQIIHILLVEDDEIDAENVMRAFKRQKIANPLTHVRDGVEALSALRGEGGYASLPRPYIILLDINMPRMNGIEFLTAIRQDDELQRSVVFVITTSSQDEDKMAAYNKQIAGYILKTRAGDDFMGVLTLLNNYQIVVELV